MYNSKYIIGIDLGTTNIAVTYIDVDDKNRTIRQFDITQFTAPGEITQNKLLPSFCFFPDEKTISNEMMDLPWNTRARYAVGIFAREYGAAIPNRFISSVKSWLCHSGVDRQSKILPWGGNIDEIKCSPLEITSYYLQHVRDAWNHRFKKIKDSFGSSCLLEEQQVVITVPASFDETARELTLEAARLAGYRNINLLEEPLAAFYSWLDVNDETWKEHIDIGQRTLVIDVGGGTCDFSIIEMTENGTLARSAAGSHLLLGGDNIDIAIARGIEQYWKTKLPPGEWLTLCQKTRHAKEFLLSGDKDETDIVLLAKGSSVIADMRKYTLKKKDLEALLLDGFFPLIPVDSREPSKKTAIQQMGLPYETDPALTRHLLKFLRYACTVSTGKNSGNDNILCPDKILFNGGSMMPDIVRHRIIEIIKSWFPGSAPEELSSMDLSLAVAYGASYYGRTQRGEGVKVKSGTSKSYYLQIADSKSNEQARLVCIMPRGIDENVKIITPLKFNVEANQAVRFPLYNSSTRLKDEQGAMIEKNDEVSFVSSLNSVLRYGNLEKKKLKAELVSELTETGVLKIYVGSVETDHQWPLNFDVRLLTADEEQNVPISSVVLDEGITEKAKAYITEVFASNGDVPFVIKELEKITGLEKSRWPLQTLRAFADILLSIKYEELKLPQKEARWLNLCGYCLRPGFGDPEDELRLRKVWTLWPKGMNNKNNLQVIAEWWVFWRRVISGLKAGHQRSVYQNLHGELYPKGKYLSNIKAGTQAKAEMWRCLGALELLQVKNKLEIGNILISRVNKLEGYEYWVLARLAARHLFHAQKNHVIQPGLITSWLNKLIETSETVSHDKLFAISRIAAMTGDRMIDIDPVLLKSVRGYLEKNKAPAVWISHLDGIRKDSIQEQSKVLGDSIPLGISIE